METEIAALTTIFTEFYYWVTVVLMFLIHVGFCVYEVGVSRRKNHLHTLMKNTILIPIVTISFFLFGWWFYWAMPNGPGITGGLVLEAEGFGANELALPWSSAMAVNLGDRINLVFWAAFLLFSWTAASIVSGAIIERIKTVAFAIIAVVIGSVIWVIDASWGWHYAGWMVNKLGYHDAYASGVIHAASGGFALGILSVLGPRIGKFRNGEVNVINPQNPWLVTIGIFLIYTGFWGFYAACNVPIYDIGSDFGSGQKFFSATNIYLTPTTLSGITANFLMSLSGGMLTSYLVSKGDPFWTYSGGLAGIILASAGNDLYSPLQAFAIGSVGVYFVYKLHFYVEKRFKIDDAVGAVAVHGYAGTIGLIICGFVLWGYPASAYYESTINPLGMFTGAVIMFVFFGFAPGWALAKLLNFFGILRIPPEIEIAGLDFASEKKTTLENENMILAEIEEVK